MGVYPLGAQRVGVELDVPVVDGGGHPVLSEFGQPQTTTVVVWVDGCLFEVPSAPDEMQGDTVTTAEPGWAVLPVTGAGLIPAVDGDGVSAPIGFFGPSGEPAISSSARLLHDGLRYVMRGDAVLERDLRGRPDHVFCRCERERG